MSQKRNILNNAIDHTNDELLSMNSGLFPHLDPEGVAKFEAEGLGYVRFGSGDPIIVLHGGPGMDHTYLLPQMLELARDHEVVFCDQRGNGQSLNLLVNQKTLTVKQFVADIEHLRKKLGYEKFTLLGHSWGGFLAINYAIEHPERLTALVVFNSIPLNEKGEKAFLEQWHLVMQSESERLAVLQADPAFAEGDPKILEEFFKTMLRHYFLKSEQVEQMTLKYTPKSGNRGLVINQVFGETELAHYDISEEAKKMMVPTLILHGKHDLVPLWTAEEMKKTIPNAHIRVFDQSCHFPYIEEPDAFFNEIRTFLAHIDEGEQ